MFVRRLLGALLLVIAAAGLARAQDQTIIVDQPLQLCSGVHQSATFDEGQAEALVKAALNLQEVDPKTYYIIHATEFVPSRMVVAAEHWYVYYKPWQQKSSFWWFKDSRQFKHFQETRIFGSSNVGIVYLYVNVPTYSSRDALPQVEAFLLKTQIRQQKEADTEFEKDHDADAVKAERQTRINRLVQSLKDALPDSAEKEAKASADRMKAAPKGAGHESDPDDVYLLSALEAQRYFKTLGEQGSTSEYPLVNQDTGEALKGLSPTLATTSSYDSLINLYYRIDVTKKLPANLQNLKAIAKLAFAGESGVADYLAVKVQMSSVCAGRSIHVDHVPSDMLVKALVGAADDKDPAERSHQLFDNEGRYWWDVSFALPLDLRRDVTIDVDAGQVAAKDVEKADLFAVVNLGMRRDTKRIQWQLIPNFVYGIPITGQPLKHHLVGFTIGLNYVQLLGGVRFDRQQEVSTRIENGTPVGVESPPPGEKWVHQWVWGINLPVNTVIKLFQK